MAAAADTSVAEGAEDGAVDKVEASAILRGQKSIVVPVFSEVTVTDSESLAKQSVAC